jgi:hypothetical protein
MQYETIEMYAAGWGGGGSNSIMSWWQGGGEGREGREGNAWELERGPKT